MALCKFSMDSLVLLLARCNLVARPPSVGKRRSVRSSLPSFFGFFGSLKHFLRRFFFLKVCAFSMSLFFSLVFLLLIFSREVMFVMK